MEKLIFLIDDTDSILTMASAVLDNDYRLLTMSSAEKMFKLLSKKQPDLILIDIEMPDMNGFEAVAALKENPDWSGIPVLFLTGYIDETVKTRSNDLGALGVLDKNEINTSLLTRVKEVI